MNKKISRETLKKIDTFMRKYKEINYTFSMIIIQKNDNTEEIIKALQHCPTKKDKNNLAHKISKKDTVIFECHSERAEYIAHKMIENASAIEVIILLSK